MKTAISRKDATERLTARWHEQCEMFPCMRNDISLALYVRANAAHVARNGLLAEYAKARGEG